LIPKSALSGEALAALAVNATAWRPGPHLVGVVVAVAAEWVGIGWSAPLQWIPDLAVGWTFIGCGLIAARKRPASRIGWLMVATGFTWFLGNFSRSTCR
jgi:hypothetical protein